MRSQQRGRRVGVQRAAGGPPEQAAGVAVDGRRRRSSAPPGPGRARPRRSASSGTRSRGGERRRRASSRSTSPGAPSRGSVRPTSTFCVADLPGRVPVARADVDEAAGEGVDLVARQLPERAGEAQASLRQRQRRRELVLVQRVGVADRERGGEPAQRDRGVADLERRVLERDAPSRGPSCSRPAAPRSRARACGCCAARAAGAATTGTPRRSAALRRARPPDRGRARGSSLAAAREPG